MVKIELEFKRIQTYLFATPRLRAMLGANATLGKTIRVDLPVCAQKLGAASDTTTTLIKHLPQGIRDDPLTKATGGDVLLSDLPAELYKHYGVLVRDGGHFIATFPDRAKAEKFLDEAQTLIAENLPGILSEARIDGQPIPQRPNAESLFHHPAFQVSHQLGNRPASQRSSKGTFISDEEQLLEERGRSFRTDSCDVIALLEKSNLIPRSDAPLRELADLVGNDHLALIHADGNGIGKRYQAWRARSKASAHSLEAEAHGEHFFYSMRVAVRHALVQALNATFADRPASYQLLMLGGDDLLLVCAASLALPFVRNYAEALTAFPLSDGEPLTIGAGVAIAKKSFPFHRLHEMAEAMADSAKQRYRADPKLGSVVDWHLSTNSWVTDPIAERCAESLTANAVLSAKPYPVLGSASLDQLLQAVQQITPVAHIVARSQLRNLVEVMRQGQYLTELAWLELPKEMRRTLEEILRDFGSATPPWQLEDGERAMTVVADLVELLEIGCLAQRQEEEMPA